MEQERLDKELEIESRIKSNQYIGLSRRPWNGNRKSRFSPYSRNNVGMGRRNSSSDSQASVRQPIMPPRHIRIGGVQTGGNMAPWCNICKKKII